MLRGRFEAGSPSRLPGREDIAASWLLSLLKDFNPGDVEEVYAVFVGPGGYLPLRGHAFLDLLAEQVDIGVR